MFFFVYLKVPRPLECWSSIQPCRNTHWMDSQPHQPKGNDMDAQVKGTKIAAADTEKQKALQAALAQIEKQFGKGTIMRLGEGEVIEDIQVVSTGSLGLDIALGVGGLPRGRVVEIYGPESSGKTTLTLQVVDSLVRSGAVDLIVIDSVAALTPKAEIEGEMGDSLPGLQARLMSQALRKLTASIKKPSTMVIFINQN